MHSAAGGGRHVFVVRSSLQYLLATALAADLRERSPLPSRMLFLPEMMDPQPFLSTARSWSQSPFDRIVLIEPRTHAGPTRVRRRSALVRGELQAALADSQPASMTVFNDREESGQVALITAARDFPRAPRRCAEDGALAYNRFVYREHSVSTRLRQRLRLGRSWTDVRVLGTHPLVQQFIAIHPPLLRRELRHRPHQPFPEGALELPALRSLATAMCEATGFVPASVPAGATVLTVSHSSYAERNPAYPQLVKACASRLAGPSGKLFVKYHPRESQADYLGLCGPGAAVEISRTLPVECLYLLLRDRPLTVVGGMSTSLLTAALLMPQVRCTALTHASASGDAWDAELMAALRITPLADEAAIAAYFDA
jgi:hypothetical protein